ncbi:Zinc-regulated transporter [Wickerhamomyces ciferrii]|uniref:Zinc-regulated transporter n=1 Tax=Wickerhamomyces ciferrii (strain ATCC 14091 / BCRC 22168 / CBS 111 / JCM 3599 / NBRC 0793 / NRRL Y-1031 F-60-10) TaxID=1206466 RepID=K0L0Y1_WICCF|nr:Zinc-regulated transporter [Wickerhamomyces ciferrii]CCH47108.1 Zinc-regulated transporter [Wickerhamomyces ciferrii]
MSNLNPDTVLLTDPNVDNAWKTCVLQGVYFGENEYNGQLGARISSIFVILFVSTGFTIFPLLARSFKKLKLPLYFYIFARYFGSGVILATAFIHLMDPAYLEIGGQSCVGSNGNWSAFPWCATIIMTSVFVIFLIDVISDVYVERKYGQSTHVGNKEIMDAVVRNDEKDQLIQVNSDTERNNDDVKKSFDNSTDESSIFKERSFKSQIAAFLVLEFGIIFHSVMIGLNLGAVGEEFKTLYIV